MDNESTQPMSTLDSEDDFFVQAQSALDRRNLSEFKEICSFHENIKVLSNKLIKTEADHEEFKSDMYRLFFNALCSDYDEYTYRNPGYVFHSQENPIFVFSTQLLEFGVNLNDYPDILHEAIYREMDHYCYVDQGYGPAGEMPDGRITAFLVEQGACLNWIGINGTVLDYAYQYNSSYPGLEHPQAIEILKRAGVKRILDFSEEEWLKSVSFVEVCKQGILKYVKKYLGLFSVNKAEIGRSIALLFNWGPGTQYWWGSHEERKYEEVLQFLLNLDCSLPEIPFHFYHLLSTYLTSLNWWDRTSSVHQNQSRYEKPPQPLKENYCPILSLSQVMGMLLEHGAEINWVKTSDMFLTDSVTEQRTGVTALDLVLEGLKTKQKTLDFTKQNFESLEKKLRIFYFEKFNLEIHRNQTILQAYQDAYDFLIAHGAKSYAELSNETENA
jgi:hypothetical protein